MNAEPIQVTIEIAKILDALNLPYFVGGSLALGIHGLARATMDVDIVIDIESFSVASFAAALGDDFYVDEKMIDDAVKTGRSFNVIHKEAMFKVDIFPRKDRAFDTMQFSRVERIQLSEAPQNLVNFCSAEDIILAKLEWYRAGGEVSDRQWNDILTVFQAQEGLLDVDYLKEWSKQLKVFDLLEKAMNSTV